MSRIRPWIASAALAGLAATTLTPSSAEAHRWSQTFSMKERAAFDSLIWSLDNTDTDIDAWAVEPDGDWVVVSGTNVWHSTGMRKSFVDGIKWNIVFGRTIQAADCRADGLCVAIHSKGIYVDGGVAPAGLVTTVNNWISVRGWPIRDLELPSSGFVLLGPGNVAYYPGVPQDLGRAIYDRHAAGRRVTDVAVGFSDEWALLADNNPMAEGAPVGLTDRLWDNAVDALDAERILIGRNADWVVYNGDDSSVSPDLSDPMEAIEYSLGTGSDTLWERMEDEGIVGMSIAVIDNNKVVAARGYGRAHDDEDRPVLARTPFDVASLSKYVGALTTLSVLEDTRSVGLDDDALAAAGGSGTVADWIDRVDNDKGLYGFPEGIDDVPSSITFRQLLSHTGGMRARGSTPIPISNQDTWADQSTLTFMSGYYCYFSGIPGDCTWNDSRSVYSTGTPGEQYVYSNSGFFLTQAALEDMTGDEGSTLMEDRLFSPLGLSRATGAYPLPSSFVDEIAGHHDSLGARDEQAVYPWTFAGGVTASVDDYAELVIVGLNEGVGSNGVRVLSTSSVDELLERVSYDNYGTDPDPTNYALGIGVGNFGVDDNVEDNDGVFRHSGAHPGRVATFMCGNPSADEGLVIFFNTNDDLAWNEGGILGLRNEIRNVFSSTMGWPSGC